MTERRAPTPSLRLVPTRAIRRTRRNRVADMNDRALIRAGTVGAIIAAICCATPVLAVLLPLIGLSAWLARADFIVIPLLIVFLGVAALGRYRRRATAAAQCETHPAKKDIK